MTGRWTYRVSAAGVLLLAAAAFTLSYDALHQLALDSRVRPALAWLWPVVIDGTIVVALLPCWPPNAPATRGPATRGRWPGCSPLPRRLQHRHAPDRPVAQLVFAMAPVALVLTTHLPHAASRLAPAEVRHTDPMPYTRPARTHKPAHVATSPPALARSDRAHTWARGPVSGGLQTQVAAGRPRPALLCPSGRCERAYGQRLLAEFTAEPGPAPATQTATVRRDRPAPVIRMSMSKGVTCGQAADR